MPSTIEKISDNVYRLRGEQCGLPLQAGEVAFTGKRGLSGWILVGIGVAVVLIAVTVGRL